MCGGISVDDREKHLEASVVEGIEKVPRDDWNSVLAPNDSPFIEWDFLHAMERSGSAARGTGWAPYHIVVRETRNKRVVAACPLYLKTHSMGEFVFDHSWADAAERAGIRYYPKLVMGVPFTPHTGRRILTAPGGDRPRLLSVVGQLAASLCNENKLSSVHVNFCMDDEADALRDSGYLERSGYQYHWRNLGYANFDDYLARLRHKRRAAVRRERSALEEQRVTVRAMVGDEISDRTFAAMYDVYISTIDKLYWGRRYLTREFFDLLRDNFRRCVCFVGAYSGRELIAGTINFEKSGVLYGRYWGCFKDLRFLHFNVCYYAGIEHCIERKLMRFEPGAGGEYKWLRGFDPVVTRSAHYFAHAGLKKAIANFLTRERREVEAWVSAGHSRSQLKPPPPSDEEAQ